MKMAASSHITAIASDRLHILLKYYGSHIGFFGLAKWCSEMTEDLDNRVILGGFFF